MAEYIEGLVRALGEGNIAAKAAAALALRDLKGSPVYCMSQCIAEDGGIPPLIELLQDGSAESKVAAAEILAYLAHYVDAHAVAIADYGGVPPLVDLLRDGSADAKESAAAALQSLAYHNAANILLIVEAGSIPLLVDLLRDGTSMKAKWEAAGALESLARNNDANAVAIAATIGIEALVQLARRGEVTVNNQWVVPNAALPAERKAALVVAALLGDSVPDSVPREVKALIGAYL
ncbi:hypothetical protein JL722_7622 [Aureococcus anophagefferens]|nr:hypothetical protein JL722_7622 [Aureococcus anophagefferens]